MANTTPLPNPWTGTGRSVSGTVVNNDEEDSGVNMLEEMEEDSSPMAKAKYILSTTFCSPCLGSEGPASEKFMKLAKTFCFGVAVFDFLMFIVSLCVPPFGFAPPSTNPMLGPNSEALVTLGALSVDHVRYNFQVWRMFTCIFLHAGIIHYVMNMTVQLGFGLEFEKKFSSWKTALVYIISGIGGSVVSLCTSNGLGVGASGALVFPHLPSLFFSFSFCSKFLLCWIPTPFCICYK
eukprot:TRINITY_DN759_c0_g1_i7.p2 TRINITY_DN759_c0_g1~~TRINITY_DN759_c0_g1_i7.p2  ORF type:complete len:236 (-),score=36.37 TRINITY_DN759_c0_g1_i7:1459-2166(-)